MRPMRWIHDLLLGTRLSVAAGRGGWARLAMIAVGVGLGVVMLLTAAALPTVASARANRDAARLAGPDVAQPGPDTLLIAQVDSRFRDVNVDGHLIQAEGPEAPLPPGVARRLAPGEMVVSPALADLLNSPGGALLRDRWNARVVGTIGEAGLTSPTEHIFYVGAEGLVAGEWKTHRIRSFGDPREQDVSMDPLLLVLGVVGLVVLLLPIMVFVTTAVRFGSEARDRQLAAIRLVGADTSMTRRIAAGETLTGALIGLLLGGLLFAAVGSFVPELLPSPFGFFAADLRPVPVLLVLVLILVPLTAVLVTLSALRRVVIEPLGVVRRTGERRRGLWWRLVPPVVGVALLAPLASSGPDEEVDVQAQAQIAAGVTLLLAGIVLLLPWIVQATVRRLGTGSVTWDLAVRRLQLDSATAVRAVSGIAMSVAGIIAVQGLIAAFDADPATAAARSDRYQVTIYSSDTARNPQWLSALSGVPGVTAVSGVATLTAAASSTGDVSVRVAECTALRQYAELGTCADGDSFVVGGQMPPELVPGTKLALSRSGRDVSTEWTVPAGTRTAPAASDTYGAVILLATPAAFGGAVPEPDTILLRLDGANADAVEHVRNATSRVDPFAAVQVAGGELNPTLVRVQQASAAGAAVLLFVIGSGMLVNVLEQLRERRRLLALLVAFGTRRRTLSGSVLYQVAIPVTLGLVLAVSSGTGTSALLASVTGIPVRFDWPAIGTVASMAAAVVLLITTASLPLLWRLTRPESLRSE